MDDWRGQATARFNRPVRERSESGGGASHCPGGRSPAPLHCFVNCAPGGRFYRREGKSNRHVTTMSHTAMLTKVAYPRTDEYVTLERCPSLTEPDSGRRIIHVKTLARSRARGKNATGVNFSKRVSNGVPISHVAKPTNNDMEVARKSIPARMRREPSCSSISPFLLTELLH